MIPETFFWGSVHVFLRRSFALKSLLEAIVAWFEAIKASLECPELTYFGGFFTPGDLQGLCQALRDRFIRGFFTPWAPCDPLGSPGTPRDPPGAFTTISKKLKKNVPGEAPGFSKTSISLFS